MKLSNERKSEQLYLDHPVFCLENGNQITRKKTTLDMACSQQNELKERTSLLNAISAGFQRWLLSKNFAEICHSNSKSETIFASSGWSEHPNVLIIIPAPGSKFGVWSLSLCLEFGLQRGTMCGFVQKAVGEDFGVVIFNPPDNKETSTEPQKGVIQNIWSLISGMMNSKNVSIIAYLDAGLLAKAIIQEDLRLPIQQRKVKSVLFIETMLLVDSLKDSGELKKFLNDRAINWVGSSSCIAGSNVPKLEQVTGCKCISIGNQPRRQLTPALTIDYAIESMFRFLKLICRNIQVPTCAVDSVSALFMNQEAEYNGRGRGGSEIGIFTNFSSHREAKLNKLAHELSSPKGKEQHFRGILNLFAEKPQEDSNIESEPSNGKFGLFFSWFGMKNPSNKRKPLNAHPWAGLGEGLQIFRKASLHKNDTELSLFEDCHLDDQVLRLQSETVTVNDFELLRVVGKGTFGKVMLVKKKNGKRAQEVFAMKILRKSLIVERGQIENTLSEFRIFCLIRHPFICRLRYAFQNQEKLYLVTDYFCGGSLFYHLKEAHCFSEEVCRFYMSEILLAIDHLHSNKIIYRDLKLENVIMDQEGHIAITDFGLSKMHSVFAKSFCGTTEYMAPELVRGHRYGLAADWWSFGIMLYEMLVGKTPFYDKNRNTMFKKITQASPAFPTSCSNDACSVIRLILVENPASRLGAGKTGAQAIKKHRFFSSVNFEHVYNRQVKPPFVPEIEQDEVKYVPNTYLEMQPRDSAEESTKSGCISSNEFEEFHYFGTPTISGTRRKRFSVIL